MLILLHYRYNQGASVYLDIVTCSVVRVKKMTGSSSDGRIY
jgi:hypothetical protein